MSYDPQIDWQRFREVVEGYCERSLRDFPEMSQRDLIVICYKSFNAFVERFSSPEARDEILEHLEQVDEKIRDALEFCRPIFDAMPVEGQQKVDYTRLPLRSHYITTWSFA